jgi:hypothetical protein
MLTYLQSKLAIIQLKSVNIPIANTFRTILFLVVIGVKQVSYFTQDKTRQDKTRQMFISKVPRNASEPKMDKVCQ